MMRLTQCTFSGLDAGTDIDELISISQNRPWIEFGVLYSQNPDGRKRYPEIEMIKTLGRLGQEQEIPMSIHLCGSVVNKIVSFDDDFISLIRLFKRCQVNINYTKNQIDIEKFRYFVQNVGIPVITQANENNQELTAKLLDLSSHHLLFDSSGGEGKLIVPPRVIPNKYCGYAGGLGPDNIPVMLSQIETLTDNQEVWIDMESSIRTDDQFDLKKIDKVIQYLEPVYFARLAG